MLSAAVLLALVTVSVASEGKVTCFLKKPVISCQSSRVYLRGPFLKDLKIYFLFILM